jgi:O-antigen/teichoic acid export membrane protein
MATAVSARLDQALIAPFLGAAPLGLYAVAVTVSSLPLAVASSVGSRAYAEVGATDEGQQLAIAASYLRMTLLLAVPATAIVGVIAPLVVPLVYGPAFRASVTPTLLLIPSSIALSFLITAESCMSAMGRPGRVSLAEALGTSLGIIGLLLLLRPLGVAGAALASSTDACVTAVAMVVFYRKLGQVTLLPRRGDLALLRRRIDQARGSLLRRLHPPLLASQERDHHRS